MSQILKILLVEDEEIDQIAFSRFVQLEALPYDTVIVDSIAEAKSALADNEFDIIITDYNLGVDNAFDLLDDIKNTPWIIITGLGDEKLAVNAMKFGAADYLVKDTQGNYLKVLPLVVTSAIKLKKIEDELTQYRENLEIIVAERTKELSITNQQLQQEINERKQAEAQILLQSTALESAVNGILITDSAGEILWANFSFEEMTGYSLDEMIGNDPSFFRNNQGDATQYRNLWTNIQQGKPWHGEMKNIRKEGGEYVVEMTITPVINIEGEITHHIAICQDITEKIRAKNRLEYQATHDILTSLPNRRLFQDRLEHAIGLAKRQGNQGAVLLIDLDDFKSINDVFSHLDGDEFLKLITIRLIDCLRESDTIARIGGDEFAVLLENVDELEVSMVAEKINHSLSKPVEIKGNTIVSTASIGVSIFPQDGETFPALFKNADLAMYQAKEEKNKFRFYTQEMETIIKRNLEISSYLHNALENSFLELHYQPQVNSETGNIVGFEGLLRLPQSKQTLSSTGEIILIAEKTDLITRIDEWVIQAAGKKMKELSEIGFPKIKMAINLSARQLTNPYLPDRLEDMLNENDLKSDSFELEISENNLFQNVEKTISTLSLLKEIGFDLAIDDFGTGFSSLSYLAQFPLDTLKIDMSFTQKVPSSKSDVAIVTAVAAIAKNLKLNVVVEGVEKKEQLDFFSNLGCHMIQGYLFSPAVPGNELETLLNKNFNTVDI